MNRKLADPFDELVPAGSRISLSALGARLSAESADETLLQLASEAFGNLPRRRLPGSVDTLSFRLNRTSNGPPWPDPGEPPRPRLSSGLGYLCATIDAGNFAIVDVGARRSLIGISGNMLRHRYHARYELIEFAVLTLAARTQSLVPLHAACVGKGGAGLLLMGGSGAGKSTLSLHAAIGGLTFLGEDSAFVDATTGLITGSSAYLHLDKTSVDLLGAGEVRDRIRRSPVIQRRSGARKFEVDMRALPCKIAPRALRHRATVFLSRRQAGSKPALQRLDPQVARTRLRREQPYALKCAQWRIFENSVMQLPAFELRRTSHPETAVQQLLCLID